MGLALAPYRVQVVTRLPHLPKLAITTHLLVIYSMVSAATVATRCPQEFGAIPGQDAPFALNGLSAVMQ